MCVYSMALDWGMEKLNPWYPQGPTIPVPYQPFTPTPTVPSSGTIQIEYVPSDEWKKKFLSDLIDLLQKAKQYDIDNGEPDCELESKKEKLKAIAYELGVEISFP